MNKITTTTVIMFLTLMLVLVILIDIDMIVTNLSNVKEQIEVIDVNTASVTDKVRSLQLELIRLELEYGNVEPERARIYKLLLNQNTKAIIESIPK